MDILLLFAQEVRADRVQRVAAELVITLNQLQQVELETAVGVGSLGVTVAHLLAGEVGLLGDRLDVCARPVLEAVNLEVLGPVEEVGKVEVGNVVACDDVRVHLVEEVPPGRKHLLLLLEGQDLGGHDGACCVEAEDISNEGLLVSVLCDDVGDLDDRVVVGLGEDALATGAFDIEREDPQGGHLGPFADRFVGNQIPVADLGFDLAVGLLVGHEGVPAGRCLNPGHACNL